MFKIILINTGFGNGAGFGGFGNDNAGAGDRPRVSKIQKYFEIYEVEFKILYRQSIAVQKN